MWNSEHMILGVVEHGCREGEARATIILHGRHTIYACACAIPKMMQWTITPILPISFDTRPAFYSRAAYYMGALQQMGAS